jgi:hypothetical protein
MKDVVKHTWYDTVSSEVQSAFRSLEHVNPSEYAFALAENSRAEHSAVAFNDDDGAVRN